MYSRKTPKKRDSLVLFFHSWNSIMPSIVIIHWVTPLQRCSWCTKRICSPWRWRKNKKCCRLTYCRTPEWSGEYTLTAGQLRPFRIAGIYGLSVSSIDRRLWDSGGPAFYEKIWYRYVSVSVFCCRTWCQKTSFSYAFLGLKQRKG